MARSDDLAVEIARDTRALFRPPKRRSLSQWADEHFYLSEESSAVAGRWKTLPVQRGVMDAISDPDVRQVSWQKCARIGATKIINATCGFYVDQDPCPMLVVQPTVEDAKGYSREEIAPMLRDVPRLARLVLTDSGKKGRKTMLHMMFAGGSISMVGANSGRGFRRVSRKVVLFDEVDEYPASAGTQGDPIKLGMNRSQWYWDRKTIAVSTPGLEGASRIHALYLAGDQRQYYVPCPKCGARDVLVFKQRPGQGGHVMRWPKGKPAEAYFECSRCTERIEHKDKFRMLEAGEWKASKPFKGHASFKIWAAYSSSPNATWADLATEFVAATAAGPDELKVFVNTVLGETWQDQGEAPDWQRLYQRREAYVIGTVPQGVVFLTAGVDVQRDRLVFEVVGWGANRESWSIDAGVIPGDTSSAECWKGLDELLAHHWLDAAGTEHGIRMMAVDSGYNTNTVYNWVREKPSARVIATKGSATAAVLISTPSKVDVTVRGRKKKRGAKVYPIGVNTGKTEFYGQLRQELPIGVTVDEDGEPIPPEAPPGYCHFPEFGEDFFQQLTAEQLVRVTNRRGFPTLEWQLIPGRENHFLDCRILARAAASLVGLDRLSKPKRSRIRSAAASPGPAKSLPPGAPAPAAALQKAIGHVHSFAPSTKAPELEQSTKTKKNQAPAEKKSWLGGRRGLLSRGSWLGRRR